MMPSAPIRRAKPAEEGYILVGVMFLLALLIISMMVALPKISADIQRDHEVETFSRGMQYRRAIQLYYRKFNRYPPSIDALVKTNNIRFLRKRYKDPLTGKDDWKPIMFGQNKAPLAMGFFGQPLGGAGFNGGVLAGTGPGGNNTLISNPMAGGAGQDPNAPADPNAGGNPTDPTNPTGGTNPTGPTFGGAGIVGFSPPQPKQSILVYKKKNHYNEWEFTYSPLSDMGLGGMGAPPTITGGCPPGVVCQQPTPTPTPTPDPAPQQQQ